MKFFCILTFILVSQVSFAQDAGAKWLVKPVLDVDKFNYIPDYDRLMIFEENGLKGVINADGKIIVPAEYQRIVIDPSQEFISASKGSGKPDDYNDKGTIISEGFEDYKFIHHKLFMVKKNGKWGLIDNYQNVLAEPVYDQIKRESHTKCILQKDGKETIWTDSYTPSVPKSVAAFNKQYNETSIPGRIIFNDKKNRKGFTNLQGDTIAPLGYYFAHFHPDGYIMAAPEGGNWGIIDKDNQVLLEFEYNRPSSFPMDGRLILNKNGKSGVLQFPEKKVLIPFEYKQIHQLDGPDPVYLVEKDKKWGILDGSGHFLLPLEYEKIENFKHPYLVIRQQGLYGTYQVSTGRKTVPRFKKVGNAQTPVFSVMADSLWALYDAAGDVVLTPFRYEKIQPSGSFYLGSYRQDRQLYFQLLDNKGQEITQPACVKLAGFSDDTYWQEDDNGSTHRSKDGTILRRYDPETAILTGGNWIRVRNAENTQFFHAMHPPGKEIWLEKLNSRKENLRLVKYQGKFGYMDEDGNWVVKPLFEEAEDSVNGCLKVKYNGKWGVLENPLAKED